VVSDEFAEAGQSSRTSRQNCYLGAMTRRIGHKRAQILLVSSELKQASNSILPVSENYYLEHILTRCFYARTVERKIPGGQGCARERIRLHWLLGRRGSK
jgi:hypothetical protein